MSGKIRNLMTRQAWTAAEDTSFKALAVGLRRYGVSAMPVIDDDRRVVGVVSAADLLHKVADPDPEDGYLLEDPQRRRERHKSSRATVRELMTEPAVTVGVDATVQEAAALMRRNRVKRLPVVDDEGRLVGLVSRSDLLGVFAMPDGWIRVQVHDDVVVAEFGFHDVEVRVDRGVVTLTGQVPLRSDIPRLLHAVRHYEGVVRVDCLLSFTHDNIPPPRTAPERPEVPRLSRPTTLGARMARP